MKKKLLTLTMSIVMAITLVAGGFMLNGIDANAAVYSSKNGNGIVANVINPGEKLNPFKDEDANYIWKIVSEDADMMGLDSYNPTSFTNSGLQDSVKNGSVLTIDWNKSGFIKDQITKVNVMWSQFQRTYADPDNWDGTYANWNDDNYKDSNLIGASDWPMTNKSYWDGSGVEPGQGEEEDVEGLTNWVKSDDFDGFHFGNHCYGDGCELFTFYITYMNSSGNEVTEAFNVVDDLTREGREWRFFFKDEPYQVTEGSSQTVNADSDATFRIDADFSLFENGGSVYVDGELVDTNCYTAKSGSTIITLLKEYIAKLNDGTHTLLVKFNDGSTVSTSFTVVKGANASSSQANTSVSTTKVAAPKTGDYMPIVAILFVVSGLSMIGVVLYNKRNKL